MAANESDNKPDDFDDLPAAAALRVHASSQIARTRADFERFSEMSENLETGWWSEVNSNCRYRFLNCQTTASCYNSRR